MKTRKPAWWQLYMLLPLMFVLLAAQHLLPLPGVSDAVVDTGIVLFTFGAMLVWVHLNGGLLERYEIDQEGSYYDYKITIYEPEPETSSDGDGSDDASPTVMTRPNPRFRGEHSILLKEEHKWFLN